MLGRKRTNKQFFNSGLIVEFLKILDRNCLSRVSCSAGRPVTYKNLYYLIFLGVPIKTYIILYFSKIPLKTSNL